MDTQLVERMVEKYGQRFTEGMIGLNRVLMEAAKDGVKPAILVHEDAQRFGKDVQVIEVSIMMQPAEYLPENAAIIRRFLREMECFDEEMFAESEGWHAVSQLQNMVITIKRLQEQVKLLEAKIGEKQ